MADRFLNARAGRVVPRAFLGLSVEWDSVGAWVTMR